MSRLFKVEHNQFGVKSLVITSKFVTCNPEYFLLKELKSFLKDNFLLLF